MVCAVTFQEGHVHFHSKFVNSKHRQEEKEKKQLLYKGQMGTMPSTSSVKHLGYFLKLGKLRFRNPSNTNSFCWGGKVISETAFS